MDCFIPSSLFLQRAPNPYKYILCTANPYQTYKFAQEIELNFTPVSHSVSVEFTWIWALRSWPGRTSHRPLKGRAPGGQWVGQSSVAGRSLALSNSASSERNEEVTYASQWAGLELQLMHWPPRKLKGTLMTAVTHSPLFKHSRTAANCLTEKEASGLCFTEPATKYQRGTAETIRSKKKMRMATTSAQHGWLSAVVTFYFSRS